MTHRAEQIVDALVALLTTDTAECFKHRTLPISEGEQQVPALSVNTGEDAPLDDDGASNLAFIDSLLSIQVVALVREDDEPDALTKLTELRTLVHQKIMADRSLGLAFVIDTRYGGVLEPELEQVDRMAGRQVSQWRVHYRMNITDPE